MAGRRTNMDPFKADIVLKQGLVANDFGKITSDGCPMCDRTDDVEHTHYICDEPPLDVDQHFKTVMAKCAEIYSRKGDDYTIGQADIDRLHNFRAVAGQAGITMMQAWITYTYKHWAAVCAYVKTGKVESEGIEGRFLDLINYMILGLKIIEENNNGNK